MRPALGISPAHKARVLLGVLQKIHSAMASIEALKIQGIHTGWKAMDEMESDYAHLVRLKDLVNGGEDIFTTNEPRLFTYRQLVLIGANHVIPDGEYVLSQKAGWFSVGSVSVRVRESQDRLNVICDLFPLSAEDIEQPLASCEVSHEEARTVRKAHQAA